MKDCIVELNNEMNNKIEDIKRNNIYDEIMIHSNKADWKDILAIYSIKVNNDNKLDVITINSDKRDKLRKNILGF